MIFPRLRLMKIFGGLARHQHRAGDIGREHRVEARAIEIHQVLEHAESGIVHQDVQIAELFVDFAIGPLHIGFLRNIGVNRNYPQVFARRLPDALCRGR